MQLKAYATHQGQISNKISSEDIAFVFGMDHLLRNLSSSYMMWLWGANVLLIMIIVLFNMYIQKILTMLSPKLLMIRLKL